MTRRLPELPLAARRARLGEALKRLPVLGREEGQAEVALRQDQVLDNHVLTFDLEKGETAYARRSSLMFASGDFHMTTERIAKRGLPLLGLFSGQNLWANRFEARGLVKIIAGRDFHGTVIGLPVSGEEPVWLQPSLYLGHRGTLSFVTRRVAKREFWTLTEVTGEGTVWIKAPGRSFRQKLSSEPVIVDTNYVAAVRGDFSAHGKVFTGAQYLKSGEAENVRLSGTGDVIIQTEVPLSAQASGGILGTILDIFV
ncbi:AIM24 family protein [Parvularcula lutaonensis]|uniref:AIM24 family protein n=1 Tax=Parvularcula lutaonensis TaxID=491923 RepID=A0ABV7M821_9PROT|nr:AIM24 family protein [Parvularcula lutaonensis]GGY43257.1 hypothetical protein GCM10007148_09960 [Parvularcula lutaonensis]